MFLKIDKVIINQDFISHCIIDENAERISVNLKSGSMFLFGVSTEMFDQAGKQKGVTYITANEFHSLKCYLRGDFCRNVA